VQVSVFTNNKKTDVPPLGLEGEGGIQKVTLTDAVLAAAESIA
jgi:hypothetical protein